MIPATVLKPEQIPTIMPGGVVWIDYTQSNNLTLVTGNKVSSAKDLFSNSNTNNAVQSTDSQRPVLTANAIGSQQAALFTASNMSVMTIADNASLQIPGNLTMYAVYKAILNPASGGAPFYMDVLGGNAPYGIDRGATGLAGSQFTNEASVTVGPTVGGNNINTSVVQEAFYDGTNVTVKSNTNSEVSAALSPPLRTIAFRALNIGCQKITVNRFFDGYIAEVILFNTLLSASQRLAMRQYLGNKYGVAVT